MGEPSVLVAGAGPTGLMLAAELALAGVSCRVLERRSEESNLTRAFGVHARTLELLDLRGEADKLIGQGLRVPEVRPQIRPQMGRRPLRLSLRHPESRFPYVLVVAQARTEAMLARRAAALGAEVIHGAEVVGLRQDDTGVEVEVTGPGAAAPGGPTTWSAATALTARCAASSGSDSSARPTTPTSCSPTYAWLRTCRRPSART